MFKRIISYGQAGCLLRESRVGMLMSKWLLYPGWFKTKQANRMLSLARQHAVEFREVPIGWHPATWKERLLCLLPYYRSYRLLHTQNSALRSLLQERSAKLADSDARIVELSHAREGLYRKCKERKRMLRELGVEV